MPQLKVEFEFETPVRKLVCREETCISISNLDLFGENSYGIHLASVFTGRERLIRTRLIQSST